MDQNKGTQDMSNLFRRIPSVNELLESEPLKRLTERASRTVVVNGVREFLGRMREEVSAAAAEVPSPSELAERIAEWIARAEQPALRPVINATGVLLHTGLGRAPLAEEARQAVSEMTAGYASVEIDLASGKRSQRMDVVDRTLKQLTGCEASAVVNNNAGATLIVLAALAAGKEVIVSRGQLVEIGGSFRLPDVMQQGHVVLREVGTTNKTRLADYERAMGEETGAILRVHPSNYVIRGFTESVGLEDLVALGRRHGVPVIDDIGSGGLWDFSRYGIEGEPLV
ncbi:MAG TPA: L-seryl-tRNA(Sec) selenium transferase, partial [Planctomycetaceae bacterium]|nr:L-seryl-tRNA(Sec) selenium transferase [Planctomycetaceae bacterium]